jgi:hypothetical protein
MKVSFEQAVHLISASKLSSRSDGQYMIACHIIIALKVAGLSAPIDGKHRVLFGWPGREDSRSVV